MCPEYSVTYLPGRTMLSGARSQLIDVDVAQAMAELVKQQILQQAQLAVLQQQNLQQAMVLELLP